MNTTIYPTEPETVLDEDATIRVWQNGPQWWVANVSGIGEWSGATREIALDTAREAVDDAMQAEG